eukprot:12335480-Heterocapsa_arctica.AAC.1
MRHRGYEQFGRLSRPYGGNMQFGKHIRLVHGVRIRRANAFVGMTKKEVKKGIIPEGDFKPRKERYNNIGSDGTKRLKPIYVIKKIKEENN